MEVVAQWLDDLEDLVFAVPLVWEWVRLLCLQVGLIAALSCAMIDFWHISSLWATTFAATAAASVGIWLAGAIVADIRTLQRVSARLLASPYA